MSMSLDEIRNVILLFSNPSWNGAGTISSTVIRNITALSSQMAYSARFAGNTTVLSTRYAGTANGVISGLLFVPDLLFGDPCVQETAPHVPRSAARQADLPPTNYHLVAIAPWVSGRCANAYLTSARTAPVRAFLFYLPGTGQDAPPAADDPEWHIDDDAAWMTQTNFPVYAVSGMAGDVMMQHLSLYSGNATEVPFGQNITSRFLADPEDYIRIWTELEVSTDSPTYGTWVYALIVIGVLLAVVLLISILMHLVQRQRRASLRRRIIAGEVNLEAMGIKTLTVPMEHIQTFPLFTYHYEPEVTSLPLSPRSARTAGSRPRTRSVDQATSVGTGRTCAATVSDLDPGSPFAASVVATDYQPNCEVCLEPFENRVTIIRELPCRHIFHPECIDEYLHEISSLCPVCKASMLPKGHCPKITNVMVRRVRALRPLGDGGKIRDRGGWWAATRSRLGALGAKNRARTSTSTELQNSRPKSKRGREPPRVQLQLRRDRPAREGGEQGSSRGGVATTTTAAARERMRQLAGDVPHDRDASLTRWQRIRTSLFPGF